MRALLYLTGMFDWAWSDLTGLYDRAKETRNVRALPQVVAAMKTSILLQAFQFRFLKLPVVP